MGDASNSIRSKEQFSLKKMKKKTQGETYKYLNSLINGKFFQSFENLNEFICLDAPLSYFEDSLRLMIIDGLHLESHVFQSLLSQNDHHIQRLLNCKWFFKNKLSAEYYISQILPNVSVSLRYKLINKLSRYTEDVEEAEKLFTFVFDNYNNKMAEMLLPKCSAPFILNYFSNSNSFFKKSATNQRLLYNITRRHPDVGIHILSSVIDSGAYYQISIYEKALLYLAWNHPDLFIPFYKKHHLKMDNFTFGKSLTKKYREEIKEMFLKSTKMSKMHLFKEKYLFKTLCLEDKVNFLVTMVQNQEDKLSFSNWTNLSNKMCSFLKLIHPDKRLDFLESVFEKVYNLSFKDNPKCWSTNVLEMIPTEQRRPFVETLEKLMNEGSPDVTFSSRDSEYIIYLYEFSTAFGKLKSLLSIAPAVNKRLSIIQCMVKSCVLHKDMKDLEELVEYITTRQRHDEPMIISEFVHDILNAFPTSVLTLSTLRKLNDFSYFSSLKGGYGYNRILESYILYQLKNDMNAEELFPKFFEHAILKTGYAHSFLSNKEYPEQSKTLFFASCREIMRWIDDHPSEDYPADNLIASIIHTWKELNARNENDRIHFKDIPGLEDKLRKKLAIHAEVGGENWPLDIWQELGEKVLNKFYKSGLLSYVLKRSPEVIFNDVKKISNYLMNNFYHNREFFFVFKKFLSFMEIETEVAQMFLDEFKNGQTANSRTNALSAYSYVCTAEEFGRAVEEYFPKGEEIKEQGDSHFGEIQLAIPCCIKNIRPHWKNLHLILKFFRGDFLQNVLPAFYSCCYHTRADVIIPFLKEYLSKVPQRISYKKDIIRVIAEMSDRRDKIYFCLKCWADNKHYSLRRLLLLFISKSFLEKPTRETFNALERCILECKEIEIETRPDIRDVPTEFLGDYVKALWRFSEEQKPQEKKNFRNSILWFFNRKNIGFLSQEFCEDVIRENLFKNTGLNVEQFTVCYLADDPSVRLQMILDMIRNSKSDPSTVSSFLSVLRANSLDPSMCLSDVIGVTLQNWKGYPFDVLHEERLMFICYDAYHRAHKKSENLNEEFGKELRKLLVICDHLSEMIPIFVEILKTLFSALRNCQKPINEVRTIRELVAEPKDRRLAIVAILILSQEAVDFYHQKDTFDTSEAAQKKELQELVRVFENYEDEVVEIYRGRKFGFKKSEQNEEPK